jgi:hypothetical protein
MDARSRQPSGWLRDPVLWTLAAVGAVIVGVYAGGLGTAGLRQALFWPLQPPLDLAFAICCHRVCTHPAANAAERKFWSALRTSGYVFVAGDVYSATAALAGRPAGWFPSVDLHTIVIAAGVLRAAWATLVHPVRWEGRERLRLWLDLTAAVAGGAVFAWYFWLGAADLAPGEFVASAVTATLMLVSAFGIGKLMLGGEAPFTNVTGISGSLSILVFAAGAAVPPSLLQTWNADLVHLAWLAPGVTMAVTPRLHELELLRRHGEPPERHPRRGQGWLPYVALAASQSLLVVAVAVERAMDRRVAGVLAGVTAILGLIVYRQVLVIRDNAALVRQLDASLRELAGFQDRLWHEARHDQLTQLANRTLLHERIQTALETAATDSPGAPLQLSGEALDDFRFVGWHGSFIGRAASPLEGQSLLSRRRQASADARPSGVWRKCSRGTWRKAHRASASTSPSPTRSPRIRIRRPCVDSTSARTRSRALIGTGRRKRTKMRAVTAGKRCQVASRPHASSSAAPTSPPWTSPGPPWWRSSKANVAS